MSTTKSAVLLLLFNRPDRTARVFDAIRRYGPQRLYVAGDGPRATVPEDAANCQAARAVVSPDWDCQVQTRYSEVNLGCKKAVSSAITWFFQQEEEGIILEDDCLPGEPFFYFCQELLERYRHDDRVMHIGGSNLQFGKQRGNASYYFSSIASIWGWAGWRRVWEKYDPALSLFEKFEKTRLMESVFPDRATAEWCLNMTRQVYEGRIDTWDYPLAFSIMINNGLCITPNMNLVSNIGFGSGGTRTTNEKDVHANIPIRELGEIIHPKFFIADREADLYQLSHSIPKAPAAPVRRGFLERAVAKAKTSVKKFLHS
jgi:hypothetical protein